MEKFLITFKVLYDGVLTSKEDIGELTLEIEMDEERIRKKYQFIESENDYDFDEYSHRIPVNYVAMYVKSAKVVKACNLTDEEKFEYNIYEDTVKITTKGDDILLHIGYPMPC